MFLVFYPRPRGRLWVSQAAASESVAKIQWKEGQLGLAGDRVSHKRETSTSLSMARSAQISPTWPVHTWACCPACRRSNVKAKSCRHSPPFRILLPSAAAEDPLPISLLDCSVTCRDMDGAKVDIHIPTLGLPILSNSSGTVALRYWLACKRGRLSKNQQINHG